MLILIDYILLLSRQKRSLIKHWMLDFKRRQPIPEGEGQRYKGSCGLDVLRVATVCLKV